MDTLSATIESHRHYIETVGSAIVLLFISGAILAVMCGGAYATSADGFNGVSLAFLVGALVSLAALLLVLAAVVFALFGIRSRERYDLTPPAPQIVKVVEQAQPPAPLVLTSGLSPEQVVKIGGIDKRDLAWFTEQIVATKDWTAKRWEGVTLPNGFKITNKNTNGEASPTSYAQLIQLYVDCGAITDRSPGQTGKLAVTDADRVMTLLESHFKAQNKPT